MKFNYLDSLKMGSLEREHQQELIQRITQGTLQSMFFTPGLLPPLTVSGTEQWGVAKTSGAYDGLLVQSGNAVLADDTGLLFIIQGGDARAISGPFSAGAYKVYLHYHTTNDERGTVSKGTIGGTDYILGTNTEFLKILGVNREIIIAGTSYKVQAVQNDLQLSLQVAVPTVTNAKFQVGGWFVDEPVTIDGKKIYVNDSFEIIVTTSTLTGNHYLLATFTSDGTSISALTDHRSSSLAVYKDMIGLSGDLLALNRPLAVGSALTIMPSIFTLNNTDQFLNSDYTYKNEVRTVHRVIGGEFRTEIWVFADASTGLVWQLKPSSIINNLTGVFFSDVNTGTAVGYDGVILRTTDGGSSWAAQASGLTTPLNSVFCTNINTGWAVGAGGKILHTANGGSTWGTQTSGVTNDLYAIFFTTSNIGWAVGQGGSILKTVNAGTTWTAQTSGTTNFLNSMFFTNSSTGWAVGDGGTILHTIDGGTTWAAQTSGVETSLFGVSFANSNTGWAVGDGGTILHTIDGGTTWAAQTSGVTEILNGVSFTDVNNGTAVGTNGTILKTVNGGTNWLLQESGTTYFLNSIFFSNSNIGWAVGDGGTILKTSVGGPAWKQLL
jgi:photosystem II stability/assembly factor-like uncharacterized protein